MMKHSLMTVGGLAFVLACGPAQAETLSPRDRADLQCFVLTMSLAGMAEVGSEEQSGLAMAGAYYLGQLRGRTAATDWLAQARLYALSGGVDADMQAQSDRCSEEITALGHELVDWGEALMAEGRKGQ